MVVLLNMPTLERHKEYSGLSFICKLLNYNIDCPGILNRLNFKLNVRHLRSIEYFQLGNYHTNYGRFNPLQVLLMIYNSCSGYLLNDNIDSIGFKFNFYNSKLEH